MQLLIHFQLHILIKINKMCIEYHFFDTKPELLQNMIDKLKTSYSIKTRKILPSIGFLYAKKNNL